MFKVKKKGGWDTNRKIKNQITFISRHVLEDPKYLTRNELNLIKTFSKVSEYKINTEYRI